MTCEITALKFQKKNKDRVSVYLDGRFSFGLPAIVAATLHVGQVLSEADVESLKEKGAVEGAYNRVLNYLSYRPRSRQEVLTYLQRLEVSDFQSDQVIGRLERVGLLDDDAFAHYWIENRERFRPRGLRALRYELREKGVGREAIERAVADVDVAEGAYRAADKKVRQLSQADEETFRRKVIEYLARRGFSYEVARSATERHWTELHTNE